ncbi:MAG: glycosyltransferase [Caldilineaceae bacterium]
MSKIVILTPPAYGHINPTLPVAQELVRRGEQVIYYCTEEFRQPVEQTGAAFYPYPEHMLSAEQIAQALQDGNMVNIPVLLLRATERLLPFFLPELAQQRPDLLFFDSTAVWGKMAATILKLRGASSLAILIFDERALQLTPRKLFLLLRQSIPRAPALVRSGLRLRRQYGPGSFPAGRPLFPMRDGLNLVFSTRTLQPHLPVIDGTFHFVGPSINEQARAEANSLNLAPRAAPHRQPLVYIALGTIHHAQPHFYNQCFAALGDFPARFILAIGKSTELGALNPIPANFEVHVTVPQLQVLQHADLFITHGGINSVHEGLYYGVPLLVIPQQFEQMMNGYCVAKQGAALVMDDQVLRGRVDMVALRQALETMLADARFTRSARIMQKELQATGGYRQAADELQAYIKRPAPLPWPGR